MSITLQTRTCMVYLWEKGKFIYSHQITPGVDILPCISPVFYLFFPAPSNLFCSCVQAQRLEATKAEMGEVREENERLKMLLARIVEDYKSLQSQFSNLIQQERGKTPVASPTDINDFHEPELVSLRLGPSSSTHEREEKLSANKKRGEDHDGGGLSLALERKFEGSRNGTNEVPTLNLSSENSFEDTKEQEAGEPWPPSKIHKNNVRNDDDEVSQQLQVKKARVSVRARCDTPTVCIQLLHLI